MTGSQRSPTQVRCCTGALRTTSCGARRPASASTGPVRAVRDCGVDAGGALTAHPSRLLHGPRTVPSVVSAIRGRRIPRNAAPGPVPRCATADRKSRRSRVRMLLTCHPRSPGRPACLNIPLQSFRPLGVCASAFVAKASVVVPDVVRLSASGANDEPTGADPKSPERRTRCQGTLRAMVSPGRRSWCRS